MYVVPTTPFVISPVPAFTVEPSPGFGLYANVPPGVTIPVAEFASPKQKSVKVKVGSAGVGSVNVANCVVVQVAPAVRVAIGEMFL